MVATENKTVPNSAFLFAQLNSRLKGQPEASQKVLNHIKAVSGKDSMGAFLNDGATEDEKREVLAVCLRAIITRDYSKLKSGPAEVKAPEPPKPVKMQPAWPPGNKMAEPIEVKVETTTTANDPPPVPVTVTPPVDPKLAAVMAAIQDLAKPQSAGAADVTKLKELVAQAVLEAKMELLRAVDDLFEKRMSEFCKKVAAFAEEP